MILLDTSGLLAAIDSDEAEHERAVSVLRAARPPRVISPFVLAELDYLLGRRIGRDAQLALLQEVARGSYELAAFPADDVAEARDVIIRYGKLELGLADASIVILARRYGARDVLTLDERHFRVLRGPRSQPFRILPADAP